MVRSGPVSWFSPSTTYRPALPAPEGREEARSAGRWGSFEGWLCATPPCEERGAQHDATSTFQQTMTGEFRAGHGRLRSREGREDQADATTKGSVVCRLRVPGYGISLWPPSQERSGRGWALWFAQVERDRTGAAPSVIEFSAAVVQPLIGCIKFRCGVAVPVKIGTSHGELDV
ncbi:MAG TPA: hypothetical protein PKH75_08820 [Bacillota bacterium]|nr:hypothetical protein [Bacillota bacterium]